MLEQYRLNEEEHYQLILKFSVGTLICQPVSGFKPEIAAIFDEAEHIKALQQYYPHSLIQATILPTVNSFHKNLHTCQVVYSYVMFNFFTCPS